MKYKIKEGLVWEEIDGKIVVLDPEKGKYFNLNKTAGEIWKSLKRPLTEKQIIDKFRLKYEQEGEVKVARDVKECLKNLLILRIIVRS